MKTDDILILPAPEPDPRRLLFLWFALLVAGTVTAPQVITTGQTSGLGIWTLAIMA